MKLKTPRTILVDFDRVIHRYSHSWMDGTIYDEPVPGAIEAIRRLQSEGFEVIIFTTKTHVKERNKWIREWLKKYGLKLKVTHTKYPAMALIDDRAIRFTHWRDILNYFL